MFAAKLTHALLRGNRLGLWTVVFVLFASMGAAWATASPLASVPDEPAHIVKAAAVVRGEPFAQRTTTPDGLAVWTYEVPEVYAEIQALACNSFKAVEPVRGCTIPLDAPEGATFEASTGAGGYNPAYYALVGWPSLLLPNLQGILGMRIVSAILSAAFLAAAVWAASWLRHRSLPIAAALFVVTPSAIFYNGGVNPQGLEVSTLTAFTVAYLVALETRARGKLLWSLAAIMMVSGVLGAQTRNLSWVWLGVIVLVGMVWAGLPKWWRFIRRPAALIAALLVVVGIAVNIAVMISVSALDGGGKFWGAGMPASHGFFFMLWRFPEFFTSMFALFGWMDVVGNWAVAAYLVLTGSLLSVALLSRSQRRHRLALLLAVLMWWTFPSLIQALTVTQSGFIWQGRYSLPLWVLVMFIAALVAAPLVSHSATWLRTRLAVSLGAIVAAAHLASFFAVLHRQYVGLEESPLLVLKLGGASDLSYDLPPIIGPAGWTLVMLVLVVVLGALIATMMMDGSRPAGPPAVEAVAATATRSAASEVPDRIDDHRDRSGASRKRAPGQ